MEKPELISAVARETGISEEEATKIIEAFVAEIKAGLANGEKVTISGFGTFLLSKRRAKTFINPKTKQTHQIPEKMLPQFRAGTDFRSAG